MPASCYLGTSFSGLCSSVYLLSKTDTPLQVPAGTYSSTVPEIHSLKQPPLWSTASPCIVRMLKPIQLHCLTHHPCLAMQHSQTILTTYQRIRSCSTCSLFSNFEKESSTIALPERRLDTQWEVTW